ncbi:N-acetyltransferase [Curtobacterium sp. MCPF17_011]|uniref:GNAT family N-acetyltransferase n=1 Tax=unclassified Curtobacterium TaxID=257496 RepID=UPI000D9B94DF|nr:MULTISPECIES: GNAT family N-acetyltransferase [unclassified Curtobacterium]PYY33437.1 N-acetyltransferase [Curtobacterium sp. MCBD17_030]PZF08587.1 N-acetyltransferase [Curtobacterium sp. MCPF17_011]
MSVSFSVRRTVEDDWPLVRALRIENATDNPISYGATLETTLAMTEADWRLRARRGQAVEATSLAAVETHTGRWIGMMSAQSWDGDGTDPVLTGVFVSPDFRGRGNGVADALLDGIVRWVHERGAGRLRSDVHEHAEPARRFSARHGFVPTGRTRPVGFTAGNTLELALALDRPVLDGRAR